MKHFFITLFLVLLVASLYLAPAGADTADPNLDGSTMMASAAINISTWSFLETYRPMQFFRPGEGSLHIAPVFFDVPHIWDSTEEETGEFADGSEFREKTETRASSDPYESKGMGLAVGGMYAPFTGIAFTGSYVYTSVSGRIDYRYEYSTSGGSAGEYDIYKKYASDIRGSARSHLVVLMCGFDVASIVNDPSSVEHGTFAFAIGYVYSLIETDAVARDVTFVYEDASTPRSKTVYDRYYEADCASHGLILSLSAGLRFRFFGNWLSIAPYGIILLRFYGTSKDSNSIFGSREDGFQFIAEEFSPTGDGWFYPGMDIKYDISDTWSFGINATGLFGNFTNIYNDFFFNGMEMRSVSLTLIYRIR